MLPHFLFPVQYFGAFGAAVIKSREDAGALPRTLRVPATADSLNQSAKLDFNEAIVFIKPNPYKLCLQEAARQTDG